MTVDCRLSDVYFMSDALPPDLDGRYHSPEAWKRTKRGTSHPSLFPSFLHYLPIYLPTYDMARPNASTVQHTVLLSLLCGIQTAPAVPLHQISFPVSPLH